MDSFIHTPLGGFTLVLGVAFLIPAIMFVCGKWILKRFSDPKWLKKFSPLFAFVFVAFQVLRLAVNTNALAAKAVGYYIGPEILVGVFLAVIAASIIGWNRYLKTHPDGPSDPPQSQAARPAEENSPTLLNLNAAPKDHEPHPRPNGTGL